VLIWMVILVVGSVTDVEVESVPVVVFGLNPVFGAGGASGGGFWRGVFDSMSGASLVSLSLFGLDSDVLESFGAGAGLLNGALADGVGATLPPVPPSVSPWITDVVWESDVA